jgi:hypothetical protein
VRIAVSSSARNGIVVGMGGVVRIPLSMRGGPRDETFTMTLGPRTEQNPFSAELAALQHAACVKAIAESQDPPNHTDTCALILHLLERFHLP